MWKKKLSQCQLNDVITFKHERPYFVLPQEVSGILVGISYTEPLKDGQDVNWLLGFKEKPFDGCFENTTQVWLTPTTLSKKVAEYPYYWYLTEDQEVKVLVPKLEPSVEKETAAASEFPSSEPPPTPKTEQTEPIITIGDGQSSFTVPYTTFTCSLCKREHISFDKDGRGLYKIPSSITTTRLNVEAPEIDRAKGDWYIHCKDHCP